MANDQDPLDDAPDPTEDTPDAEAEDTAEDDDSGQSDWTPKDRKEALRKVQEQGQENARLRAELELLRGDGDEADDAEDDVEADDQGDGTDDAYTRRLERQSWTLAEQIHGREAVDAYNKAFYPLYDKAQTPADHIAALEAYHRARLGEAPRSTSTADKKPSRDEALRPRVDSNRSDGSPDSDDKIAEARKSGKLSDFTGAAAAALGFGPSKR